MRLPTRSQRATLLAIRDANGKLQQEQLAEQLGITVKALAARLTDFAQDSKKWVATGRGGRKWDYVRLSGKGAALLEAALQAEAQETGVESQLTEAAGHVDPMPTPRPLQGMVAKVVIIDDPEPEPTDYAHGLAAALGYDPVNSDCPPWMDLLEEVVVLFVESKEAQEQLHKAQTRAHNQAEVIEVLRRDLAEAKTSAADPEVLTELEDLRRESLEVVNALEGFPGGPTTKQGKAVLGACRDRAEALAEVKRLQELAGSYQQDAAALKQVRAALEGDTRVKPERGTLAAEVANLVRQVTDLTGAEEAAWERGRVWGRAQIVERLGWIIDHRGECNYTEEGYIEQVRLLKAAADANTDMAFEADEDGISLRLGDPRLGLRILLASWDEVGPNGGHIYLYGWDGPEYLTVPVTCREMGKSVALALLASRGVRVPEMVFVEQAEDGTEAEGHNDNACGVASA